jgi:hypothetical protein
MYTGNSNPQHWKCQTVQDRHCIQLISQLDPAVPANLQLMRHAAGYAGRSTSLTQHLAYPGSPN